MISRFSVRCGTCEKTYTLRVSIGRNQYQEHTFPCVECTNAIVIALELQFATGGAKTIYKENCYPAPSEGLVVNLHPDFLIPDDMLHKDQWSPNLFGMSELSSASPNFMSRLQAEGIRPGMPRKGIPRIRDVVTDWTLTKRLFSLLLNRKQDAAERLLSRDGSSLGIASTNPRHVLIAFLLKIGRNRSRETLDMLLQGRRRLAEGHPGEQVTRMDTYVVRNHVHSLLRSTFIFLSTYMEAYSDLSQTIEYQDAGIDIKSGYSLTSHAFVKTRLVYGEAFELLGSMMIIPSLINNIEARGSFDQFASLKSISEFLGLDKSSRFNNFATNAKLSDLSDEMDNRLRNGSHHGAMFMDEASSEVVYTPKKDGPEERISYISYVAKCNLAAQRVFGISAYLLTEYPTF